MRSSRKPKLTKGKRTKYIATVMAALGLLSPRAETGTDHSRLSDQPAPLRIDEFPRRPPPLLELGDKFLSTGNLQKGFTLPTGAVWSPNFWVYGQYRTALQSFDPGYAPRTTEWANRLDLYGNLQLAATERIVVGFRPVDRTHTDDLRFSGYNFEPSYPEERHGWQDEFRATPTTLFFEGEFGEIFPGLDKGDSRNLDYGFSVGRQPLLLQDGLLVNDDSIDMVSITRNALLPTGTSTLRVTGLYGWNEIERGNSIEDASAHLIGLDAATDLPYTTVEANMVYVPSNNGGDGFYAGIGAIRRIWKFNLTARAVTSVATEQESDRVRNGTLLFTELSIDPPGTHDIAYLNFYVGFDEFTSADRSLITGGVLGRAGLLNAAQGLGRYGAPLSGNPQHAVGANLGYQMFFGELRRRQLVLEVGGRVPTKDPLAPDQEAAAGVSARFQQAIGRRYVATVSAFGVERDDNPESYGGRVELLVKF